MKYYFTLQYKMLNRQLTDFGINPAVAYLLITLLFITVSKYLFNKAGYIAYVYALIPLILVTMLGEVKRNEFLKSCFSKSRYNRIRLIENSLAAIPFSLFLIYEQKHLIAAILFVLANLLSFISLSKSYNFTIPTPFFKYPFEFTVGFRNSIYLIIAAYILAIIAIVNGNFNLGIFAMITLLLCCMSFYITPEPSFYVWTYSLDSKSFIWNKIKVLTLYTTALCFPLTIILAIFFFDKVWLIIGLQGLGYLYILTALLSKYANFPKQIILPEVIILGISIVFPPLLFILIPYFYIKSQKRLKEILE